MLILRLSLVMRLQGRITSSFESTSLDMSSRGPLKKLHWSLYTNNIIISGAQRFSRSAVLSKSQKEMYVEWMRCRFIYLGVGTPLYRSTYIPTYKEPILIVIDSSIRPSMPDTVRCEESFIQQCIILLWTQKSPSDMQFDAIMWGERLGRYRCV